MHLILSALRRPFVVLVAILALALACTLALGRSVVEQLGGTWPDALPKGMEVDIFPSLNLPVIYVCQPYGGMDPAQMEGFLTNYYEYHFLYITGIHHVESRNIQGIALMKLFFHPGTNMAQAMAETINYVNRSRAFMPPGTVSPFVMRFDTGSVPVGYLVLSSETRSIGEIQDLALFRVRPMFASLPGVSAPPPFGGSQRTVVVTVDPAAAAGLRHVAGRGRHRPRAAATRSARRATSRSATSIRSCRSTRSCATSHDLESDSHPHRAPARRSTSATWATSRTAPTPRPATPWSTAAAPSTSWSPSGPTPRP